MFIVFEGGDGCGKTEAIHYLRDKLGNPCISMHDWFCGCGFETKREFVTNPDLTDEQRLAMISDCRTSALRYAHVVLQSTTVLYDRFILSTYAYQSNLGIGKLDPSVVGNMIDKNLKNFCDKPLFVILRGVDYKTQQARIKRRNKNADVFDSLSKDKYNKLQRFFDTHSQHLLTKHFKDYNIVYIDNKGTLDDFHVELDKLADYIKSLILQEKKNEN